VPRTEGSAPADRPGGLTARASRIRRRLHRRRARPARGGRGRFSRGGTARRTGMNLRRRRWAAHRSTTADRSGSFKTRVRGACHVTGTGVAGLLPGTVRTIRRRCGGSSEHDPGGRRPDHRRAQRGRIAPGLRSPNRSRPHRTDNGRRHQARRHACPHHHQRPPATKHGHSNARHPHPRDPHPPPTDRPHPPQPNARPPSPHRTTHRRPHLGPLHRVMDRCRRLTPEVIRSHRTRNDPGGGGRGGSSATLLRRARPERNELLPRPEPVSRELDDVRFPVVFLACLVVGSVVFHRFCRPFSSGPRVTRPPGPVLYALNWHQFVSIRQK
jgi:hypothetical protein